MDYSTFQQSISNGRLPACSVYLQALWYDAKGNWQTAHELIQDLPDKNAAWVHAYLHRKEGDDWNADYWYRSAGRSRPQQTLNEEWQTIVTTLLQEL